LSAFYNAVDQISNDIAKLPKSVFKKDEDNRERYPDHPLNYLIATEPSSLMTAFDFWKAVVLQVILKGNCYVRIHRNSFGVEEKLIIQDSYNVDVNIGEVIFSYKYCYKILLKIKKYFNNY